MIFPNKNTDPNLSVVNSTAVLLELLLQDRIVTVDELRSYLIIRLSVDASPLFEPSINLLYLLGKIEYNENANSIIFVDGSRSRRAI